MFGKRSINGERVKTETNKEQKMKQLIEIIEKLPSSFTKCTEETIDKVFELFEIKDILNNPAYIDYKQYMKLRSVVYNHIINGLIYVGTKKTYKDEEERNQDIIFIFNQIIKSKEMEALSNSFFYIDGQFYALKLGEFIKVLKKSIGNEEILSFLVSLNWGLSINEVIKITKECRGSDFLIDIILSSIKNDIDFAIGLTTRIFLDINDADELNKLFNRMYGILSDQGMVKTLNETSVYELKENFNVLYEIISGKCLVCDAYAIRDIICKMSEESRIIELLNGIRMIDVETFYMLVGSINDKNKRNNVIRALIIKCSTININMHMRKSNQKRKEIRKDANYRELGELHKKIMDEIDKAEVKQIENVLMKDDKVQYEKASEVMNDLIKNNDVKRVEKLVMMLIDDKSNVSNKAKKMIKDKVMIMQIERVIDGNHDDIMQRNSICRLLLGFMNQSGINDVNDKLKLQNISDEHKEKVKSIIGDIEIIASKLNKCNEENTMARVSTILEIFDTEDKCCYLKDPEILKSFVECIKDKVTKARTNDAFRSILISDAYHCHLNNYEAQTDAMRIVLSDIINSSTQYKVSEVLQNMNPKVKMRAIKVIRKLNKDTKAISEELKSIIDDHNMMEDPMQMLTRLYIKMIDILDKNYDITKLNISINNIEHNEKKIIAKNAFENLNKDIDKMVARFDDIYYSKTNDKERKEGLCHAMIDTLHKNSCNPNELYIGIKKLNIAIKKMEGSKVKDMATEVFEHIAGIIKRLQNIRNHYSNYITRLPIIFANLTEKYICYADIEKLLEFLVKYQYLDHDVGMKAFCVLRRMHIDYILNEDDCDPKVQKSKAKYILIMTKKHNSSDSSTFKDCESDVMNEMIDSEVRADLKTMENHDMDKELFMYKVFNAFQNDRGEGVLEDLINCLGAEEVSGMVYVIANYFIMNDKDRFGFMNIFRNAMIHVLYSEKLDNAVGDADILSLLFTFIELNGIEIVGNTMSAKILNSIFLKMKSDNNRDAAKSFVADIEAKLTNLSNICDCEDIVERNKKIYNMLDTYLKDDSNYCEDLQRLESLVRCMKDKNKMNMVMNVLRIMQIDDALNKNVNTDNESRIIILSSSAVAIFENDIHEIKKIIENKNKMNMVMNYKNESDILRMIKAVLVMKKLLYMINGRSIQKEYYAGSKELVNSSVWLMMKMNDNIFDSLYDNIYINTQVIKEKSNQLIRIEAHNLNLKSISEVTHDMLRRIYLNGANGNTKVLVKRCNKMIKYFINMIKKKLSQKTNNPTHNALQNNGVNEKKMKKDVYTQELDTITDRSVEYMTNRGNSCMVVAVLLVWILSQLMKEADEKRIEPADEVNVNWVGHYLKSRIFF
ncbi:hypothetical protein OCOL_000723 [Ordospora colligata]